MLENLKKVFTNGIIEENGVFALALGLCPALAITTSVYNGLGMGFALMFVLTLSVFVCSLVRRFISPRVRIPVFLAVIAGFVTITDLTLKAYIPTLSESLGVFIPLIVVNCVVLGRVEVFASKNPPMQALADGLGIGVGFGAALILISGIREVLGTWKFFGMALPVPFAPVSMMLLSPGGFITIGILTAIFAWLRKQQSRSRLAEAKGVSQEEMLPEEPPDEISHMDLADKPGK